MPAGQTPANVTKKSFSNGCTGRTWSTTAFPLCLRFSCQHRFPSLSPPSGHFAKTINISEYPEYSGEMIVLDGLSEIHMHQNYLSLLQCLQHTVLRRY